MSALFWPEECDAFLQMRAASRQHTKAAPRPPEGIVGEDRKRRVVGMSRQAQQCFPDLSRRVQLRSYSIKPPQPQQHRDQLWRLAYLLTQGVCLREGQLYLGCGDPFPHLQCRAKGGVEGQCPLSMLRHLWQGLQKRDPGG